MFGNRIRWPIGCAGRFGAGRLPSAWKASPVWENGETSRFDSHSPWPSVVSPSGGRLVARGSSPVTAIILDRVRPQLWRVGLRGPERLTTLEVGGGVASYLRTGRSPFGLLWLAPPGWADVGSTPPARGRAGWLGVVHQPVNFLGQSSRFLLGDRVARVLVMVPRIRFREGTCVAFPLSWIQRGACAGWLGTVRFFVRLLLPAACAHGLVSVSGRRVSPVLFSVVPLKKVVGGGLGFCGGECGDRALRATPVFRW